MVYPYGGRLIDGLGVDWVSRGALGGQPERSERRAVWGAMVAPMLVSFSPFGCVRRRAINRDGARRPEDISSWPEGILKKGRRDYD